MLCAAKKIHKNWTEQRIESFSIYFHVCMLDEEGKSWAESNSPTQKFFECFSYYIGGRELTAFEFDVLCKSFQFFSILQTSRSLWKQFFNENNPFLQHFPPFNVR